MKTYLHTHNPIKISYNALWLKKQNKTEWLVTVTNHRQAGMGGIIGAPTERMDFIHQE